jgi:hypothetical protein
MAGQEEERKMKDRKMKTERLMADDIAGQDAASPRPGLQAILTPSFSCPQFFCRPR